MVESTAEMGVPEFDRETSNAEEAKAAEEDVEAEVELEAAVVEVVTAEFEDCIAMERRIASCISRSSSGWPRGDTASEKRSIIWR